jgi:hypothetical protein
MNEKIAKAIASVGLFIGGIFGMIGSFVSSASLRGLAWGLDGIGLIVASTMLTIYFFRKGKDTLAAGYLNFANGEGLILSCDAVDLNADVSAFGAGSSLWAASIALISIENFFPKLVRLSGFITAVLFSVVSVQIFTSSSVNALSKPLPFYAYPFFAATIFGWAWMLLRTKP